MDWTMDKGVVATSVLKYDLQLLCPESPFEEARANNASNKFPPISPTGSSIFTPCAILEEEDKPKPISSLTKLINDSNNDTPTTTNYTSADNSLHYFPLLYSESTPSGSLSCDILLKKAVKELVNTVSDENLSLFAADNDGVIMDDLPQFSRSSDIAASGISDFIVVDKRNSRHLLYYKIEKIVENHVRKHSTDRYTISYVRSPNNQTGPQEWTLDSSISSTNSKQRFYNNNHSTFSRTNSPTRSIVSSPNKFNEDNETYDSDILHEVSSSDSFSDTWVESGSGKAEIVN